MKEEEAVVFTRKNRGGSAQHTTRGEGAIFTRELESITKGLEVPGHVTAVFFFMMMIME